MSEICPRCQQRYLRSRMNTDYVHTCNGESSTLNNEDVVVYGSWSDYTGSGAQPAPTVMIQGGVSAVENQRAGIEGAHVDQYTERGNRVSTTRTRQHLEYIDKNQNS